MLQLCFQGGFLLVIRVIRDRDTAGHSIEMSAMFEYDIENNDLVGGSDPSEKYESTGMIIPNI